MLQELLSAPCLIPPAWGESLETGCAGSSGRRLRWPWFIRWLTGSSSSPSKGASVPIPAQIPSGVPRIINTSSGGRDCCGCCCLVCRAALSAPLWCPTRRFQPWRQSTGEGAAGSRRLAIKERPSLMSCPMVVWSLQGVKGMISMHAPIPADQPAGQAGGGGSHC